MRCPMCSSNRVSLHVRYNLASMACRSCCFEWAATVLVGQSLQLPSRRLDAPYEDESERVEVKD